MQTVPSCLRLDDKFFLCQYLQSVVNINNALILGLLTHTPIQTRTIDKIRINKIKATASSKKKNIICKFYLRMNQTQESECNQVLNRGSSHCGAWVIIMCMKLCSPTPPCWVCHFGRNYDCFIIGNFGKSFKINALRPHCVP